MKVNGPPCRCVDWGGTIGLASPWASSKGARHLSKAPIHRVAGRQEETTICSCVFGIFGDSMKVFITFLESSWFFLKTRILIKFGAPGPRVSPNCFRQPLGSPGVPWGGAIGMAPMEWRLSQALSHWRHSKAPIRGRP